MFRRILNKIKYIKSSFNEIYYSFLAYFGNSAASLKAEQETIYANFNLDRHQGILSLNKALTFLGLQEYNENNGMYSEHMVLIAAISENKSLNINSILEIGTWTGEFTMIMSILFPDSKITTIDLPQDLDDFKNFYNRENDLANFIETRNNNISDKININFIELNSVFLTESNDQAFDLIWVDGAHGYPTITSDIINAYRLLRPEGICLIDDVWTKITSSDKMYKSVGAFETLVEMKKSKILDDFSLFLKRLHPKKNINLNKKFVGAFQKKNKLKKEIF
ncbi:MAG: hypothetical protein CML98_08165 [Rhodobiaceae bacterium]|nr:hypothetical protein [Rhodobiaceae bacterium]|tara:strand:- start:2963 stop:3799 length:837 start_codon:yes stop_codon:yes gene_type:complete